jgi:hypothetical protein
MDPYRQFDDGEPATPTANTRSNRSSKTSNTAFVSTYQYNLHMASLKESMESQALLLSEKVVQLETQNSLSESLLRYVIFLL